MGDCVTAQSQETDGEGEPFSFSKLFHDVEAYYISIGMTYDQFWYGDVWLAKVYRDAEELRERRANAEAWRNGFYMASALSSTVGNMFRKKGSKPIKYTSARFYGAFIARNKGIKRKMVDDMLAHIEDKEGLMAALMEMYADSIKALVATDEEDKTAKNATWEIV